MILKIDILHGLLRVIVLAISIPFGVVAAIIPAYTAGRIVTTVGLPEVVGQYLVGGIVLFCFCAYFQDKISHPKTPA